MQSDLLVTKEVAEVLNSNNKTSETLQRSVQMTSNAPGCALIFITEFLLPSFSFAWVKR